MVVTGVITRTGVFEYADGAGGIRREYRSPEEVFSPAALESFSMVPVTLGHPADMVSTQTIKDHAVGMVGSALTRDGDKIVAEMVIYDEAAIAAIEGGVRELSCGYQADMIEGKGVSPEGEHYDCMQVKIQGNHVAIVEKGRAGAVACIKMDSATMVNLPRSPKHLPGNTMDPKELQARLEELALEKATLQIEAQTQKLRGDAAEAALSKAEAERDDARDKLDAADQAAKARKDSEDDAVQERAELLALAAPHLEKEISELKGMSAEDVKRAVIAQLTGSALDEKKDSAYVAARFDMLMEAPPVKGETKTVKVDSAANVSVDSARRAMLDANRNAWKQGK